MGNIVVTRDESSLTFANPGMMLMSKEQYFHGDRSICRNPTLQKMFMLLGRAEKAGSGVDKILTGWNELGWDNPTLTEEVQPDYVVLTLPVGNTKRSKAKKAKDEKPANYKSSSQISSQISSGIKNPSALKVYQIISANPGIPSPGIAKELTLSERYVEKLIKILKDSYLIERTGSATKSGGWTIVEK